jgi:hypothetical protein
MVDKQHKLNTSVWQYISFITIQGTSIDLIFADKSLAIDYLIAV